MCENEAEDTGGLTHHLPRVLGQEGRRAHVVGDKCSDHAERTAGLFIGSIARVGVGGKHGKGAAEQLAGGSSGTGSRCTHRSRTKRSTTTAMLLRNDENRTGWGRPFQRCPGSIRTPLTEGCDAKPDPEEEADCVGLLGGTKTRCRVDARLPVVFADHTKERNIDWRAQ